MPDATHVLTDLARPKVNLTLTVLGRRGDGYHELESLVAFAAGFGDSLTLMPGAAVTVRLSGRFADAIAGKNLVARALDRLAAIAPRLVLGAIEIEKTIPVGAGLGGGSADAAAALRLVRTANPDLADTVDWHGVAAALGADVPVCLEDRPALVSGIGERITPLPYLPRLPAVLVNPMIEVPVAKTADVFRQLGSRPLTPEDRGRPAPSPVLCSLRDSGSLIGYLQSQGNDLTPPARAIMPAIDDVLEELARIPGTRLARLSGAGPTAFGLYATGFAALAAAREIAARRPHWWVQPVWLG